MKYQKKEEEIPSKTPSNDTYTIYENKTKFPFCNNKSLKSAKTFPYTEKDLVDVSSWTL